MVNLFDKKKVFNKW